MHEVRTEIRRLGVRAKALLMVQRAASLFVILLASVVILIALDFAARLPSSARMFLLVVGAGSFLYASARRMAPVIRLNPTVTQIALRLEETLPMLRGRLASGVEFASSGTDRLNPLARRAVEDLQSRLAGTSLWRHLRVGPAMREAGILALVSVLVSIIALSAPGATMTGLKRLFAPLSGAQWPARTAVTSLMNEVLPSGLVHPRGQRLALRARNLTPGAPRGRVDALVRFERGGEWGAWERVLLTHQHDDVHERLVETAAEALEISFVTSDAGTETERILLPQSPAVEKCVLSVSPPRCAAGVIGTLVADLGNGQDERARVDQPALAGSDASMTITLNRPVPVPAEGPERDAWLSKLLGREGAVSPVLSIVGEEDERAAAFTLQWTLLEPEQIDLTLTDEYGLNNLAPIRFIIPVVADAPPSVSVTEPDRNMAVLPTAVVPLAVEAVDDVVLKQVGLMIEIQRKGSEAWESVPNPSGVEGERAADSARARLDTVLDLGAIRVAAGDVVRLTGWARDACAAEDAPAGASGPRLLRIIDDVEFQTLVRQQLSIVRQNAIRIEAQQGEVQELVQAQGVVPGADRLQSQVTERIEAQRQAVSAAQDLLERNRHDDPELAQLLRQSADLLSFAGRRAQAAQQALEQGTGAEPIVRDQQEVRDELSDLIALLDRDEDTWLTQRQLEQVIDDQRRLNERTAAVAQRTIGRPMEELETGEREELGDIAEMEREIGTRTRELIDEMRRRSQALESVDPQAARGMEAGADAGERRQVERDMNAAAERTERNQMQGAMAAQESATQTLDEMLRGVTETRKAKAETLLRALESLLESIKRLIAIQESEILALEQAVRSGSFDGRDLALIRLNQNTRAVAVEARHASQDTRRIGRVLDAAAGAQGTAIAALRRDPIAADESQTAQNFALEQLREALRLAEELDQQTRNEEAVRERERIVSAFRGMAERQVLIREETMTLPEGELSRRQLADARRLGSAEEEIRKELLDLSGSVQDLADSEVFTYMLALVTGWCDEVSQSLWEGGAGAVVTDRQMMIAQNLVRTAESIEEGEDDSAFAREQGGEEQDAGGGSGGGSGSGGGGILPPVAELRRMQAFQRELLEQTRRIDAQTGVAAATRQRRVGELAQMQKEALRLVRKLAEKMQPRAEEKPAEDPAP